MNSRTNDDAVPAAKARGGWRTLGIWVTLTFIGLIVAWYFLITTALDKAPEPVPLEYKSGKAS